MQSSAAIVVIAIIQNPFSPAAVFFLLFPVSFAIDSITSLALKDYAKLPFWLRRSYIGETSKARA
jgi:hypothetical protein